MSVQKKYLKYKNKYLQLKKQQIGGGDGDSYLENIRTERNVEIMRLIPRRFTRDPEFVLQAVEVSERALVYASEELRQNPQFVLDAIRLNRGVLQYAPEELRNNPEFIIAAMRINLEVLQFASDELKNNQEFILDAVRINGRALGYASDNLRNDEDFTLVAIRENAEALRTVPFQFMGDENFALKALKTNSNAFNYLSYSVMQKFAEHVEGKTLMVLTLDGGMYEVEGWALPAVTSLQTLLVQQYPELANQGSFKIMIADPLTDDFIDADTNYGLAKFALAFQKDTDMKEAMLIWDAEETNDAGDDGNAGDAGDAGDASDAPVVVEPPTPPGVLPSS